MDFKTFSFIVSLIGIIIMTIGLPYGHGYDLIFSYGLGLTISSFIHLIAHEEIFKKRAD